MNKRQRQNISQMSKARGFRSRSEKGLFYISGPASFGPATFEAAREFLAEYPTAREIARDANVRARAEDKARLRAAKRSSNKYHWPLYDPEAGESPPSDLLGLHVVSVLLPQGSDSDDCLRNLWISEDKARRRGAPAISAKLEEARAMIASGDLTSVPITVSDHDLASARAHAADIGTVLLAAILLERRFVRAPGAQGTRSKKLPGMWRATA